MRGASRHRTSPPSFYNFSLQLAFARTRDNSPNRAGRLLRQKRTPLRTSFFGAEDEIRTRATVSHTTPLAGEPLEPLGYFCMAQFNSLLFKSYNTISHFFTLVKAFYRIKRKIFRKFSTPFKNILSKHLTALPFSFIIHIDTKKSFLR